MKNKKIKLEEFKVKSFITNLKTGSDLTIRGGMTTNCPGDQTSPNCTGGTAGDTTTTVDTAGEGCFVNTDQSIGMNCSN